MPISAPTEIAGLHLWLDASQITGKVNNDAISQWDDLSGNARHAVQGTGALQPTYQTNILNGLPAVRCVADYIKAPVASDVSFTIFVVTRKRSAPGYTTAQTCFSTYNFDGAGTPMLFGTRADESADGFIAYPNSAYAVATLGGTAQTAQTVGWRSNSVSNLEYYFDGLRQGTFDPTNVAGTGVIEISLGAGGAGQETGDFDFFEVVMYDSALSDVDARSVLMYLAAKWAVAGPPGASAGAAPAAAAAQNATTPAGTSTLAGSAAATAAAQNATTTTGTTGAAFVAERGSVVTSGAGSSHVITLGTGASISATVGRKLLLYVACDNAGVGGVATVLSISDPHLNQWSLRASAVANPAGANSGQTVYVYECDLGAAHAGYVDGDLLTITSAEVVVLAAFVEEWTGLGNFVSFAAATGATSTTASVGRAPTAAGQVVIAAIGVEGPTADGFTADADTVDGSWATVRRLSTAHATPTSNATLARQAKVITGGSPGLPLELPFTLGAGATVSPPQVPVDVPFTLGAVGQSWDVTLGVARDHAEVALLFDALGTRSYVRPNVASASAAGLNVGTGVGPIAGATATAAALAATVSTVPANLVPAQAALATGTALAAVVEALGAEGMVPDGVLNLGSSASLLPTSIPMELGGGWANQVGSTANIWQAIDDAGVDDSDYVTAAYR